MPVSMDASTCSTVIFFNVAVIGALSRAASWHMAQFSSNSDLPMVVSRCDDCVVCFRVSGSGGGEQYVRHIAVNATMVVRKRSKCVEFIRSFRANFCVRSRGSH